MKRRFGLIHALLLSLFIHFFFSSYIYLVNLPEVTPPPQTVDWVTAEELKKILDASKTEEGQIVEQAEKSVNEELPDKAKFLSQKNQRVIEETRALNNDKFKNAGLGGAPKEENILPPKNEQAEAAKEKSKEKLSSNDGEKILPSLAELKPDFRPHPKFENNSENGGDASEASSTDDHLKDIPTGAETILNTREFIYYSYYNRIKAKLRQYWEPKIKEKVERMFRQGRQLASTSDRVTKIVIVLNSGGTLIKVQVLGPSGVEDLDQAAVEAFEAAAPFPNPPKGIVDPDGTIKIRWDFVLEASAGSGFASDRLAWER